VASKSLVEWLKILWENENEYVVCCPAESVPRGWGLAVGAEYGPDTNQ
jgi:hypothetical protein